MFSLFNNRYFFWFINKGLEYIWLFKKLYYIFKCTFISDVFYKVGSDLYFYKADYAR